MERIKRGFRLAGQSWQVIRNDRSLLVFPVISAVTIVVALIAIWAPALLFGGFSDSESVDESNPLLIGLGILTAYIATFLTIFFNVALASCAFRSFDGEDTRVGEGLAAARERTGQIAAWALLATTVGLLLRALEERLPLAGRIAVWLIGVAWTIATYLVVPVLAHERVGPIDALKRSGSIVRERWGESIVGNAGIGLLTGLAGVAVVLVFGGLAAAVGDEPALLIPIIAVGALALAVVSVIGTALTQVFNVAVYRFATGGSDSTKGGAEAQIGPYTTADLAGAFRAK